jgi:chromosome segregation ATPase
MSHDDLMDLKAEREDRHSTSSRKKATAETPNLRSSEIEETNSSIGSLVFIALLLMAIAIGGLLYWMTQQLAGMSDQFDRVNQQLSLLSKRVETLEGKLDASNDTLESSEAAIRVKIKEHDSEIRKLWGVSYDRNRKTIQGHDAKIKGLEQKVKSAENTLKQSKTNIDALVASYPKIEAQNKEITEAIASMREQLKRQQSVADQLTAIKQKAEQAESLSAVNEATLSSMSGKVKAVNDELIRSVADLQIELQQNNSSATKDISELKRLVTSIDKNRARINSDLITLSKRVNELQKQSAK